MSKWTHGHHQMSNEEDKNNQFCGDSLNCYESEISEQHKDSDSAVEAVTSDFTDRGDMASQPVMSRKQMEEALEQILADVKNKRENDVKILSDFKKEVMAQAAHSCDMMEQYMNHMHLIKSKELDTQIVTLMDALSRSQKLESELEHSKTSLSLLCKDISSSAKFM